MSAQGTYRFYSVQRQTILLVNGEPLGRERVNSVKNYVPIKEETIGAIYSDSEVILKHLSSYTTYKTEITSTGLVMGEMTRSKIDLLDVMVWMVYVTWTL